MPRLKRRTQCARLLPTRPGHLRVYARPFPPDLDLGVHVSTEALRVIVKGGVIAQTREQFGGVCCIWGRYCLSGLRNGRMRARSGRPKPPPGIRQGIALPGT